MMLQPDRLEPFFTQMAEGLGLSPIELAEGILSVANAAMEKAIRVISVERGYDPREFTLFTFGGAGGMHAAYIARLLGMPKVLIPNNPGILSAIGMLMADIIKDYSLTVMLKQYDMERGHISKLFQELEVKGKKDLISEAVHEERIVLERYLDMRYEGQSYEIIVPFNEDVVESFHSLHEKNYGYRNNEKRVEIVNLRLRARGIPEKPEFQKSRLSSETPADEAFQGQRDVVFDSKPMSTRIFKREKLKPGNMIEGPSILVEYSSTIVIPPFAKVFVDAYGNLVIDINP
jgi:N-methylhydantoinase A